MNDVHAGDTQVERYFELLEKRGLLDEQAQQATDRNQPLFLSALERANEQLGEMALDPEVQAYMAATSEEFMLASEELESLETVVELGLLTAAELAEQRQKLMDELQDPRLKHAVEFMKQTGLVGEVATVQPVETPTPAGEPLYERRASMQREAEGKLTEFPLDINASSLVAEFIHSNEQAIVKRGLQPISVEVTETLAAAIEDDDACRESIMATYGDPKAARATMLEQLQNFFADKPLVGRTLATMTDADPRRGLLAYLASYYGEDHWKIMGLLTELVDAEHVMRVTTHLDRRFGVVVDDARAAIILGGHDILADDEADIPEWRPYSTIPEDDIPPLDVVSDATLTMLNLINDEVIEPPKPIERSEQQKELMHLRINSPIEFDNATQFKREYGHQLTAILERLEDEGLSNGARLDQLQATLFDDLTIEHLQEAFSAGLIASPSPGDKLNRKDILRVHALKFYPRYMERVGQSAVSFSQVARIVQRSSDRRKNLATQPNQDDMQRIMTDKINEFKDELKSRAAEAAEAAVVALAAAEEQPTPEITSV